MMTIMHIPLIRQELRFRVVVFDQSWSIKALIRALKECNIAAQKTKIEGETGILLDKIKLNNTLYLPLAKRREILLGGGINSVAGMGCL